MPVKKDGSGKRWVEMEFITPGTPEQVWQAIATGAGNSAWFTKATIEERVGGAMRFDFGAAGSSPGEVTAWEPPRLFGYIEREWSAGAPPVATEITITSRSGDRCVVRMVHSLFSASDEWDDQLEGFESGWPSFFEALRIYLSHFPGRKAATFYTMVGVESQLEAWTRLIQALDLGGANAGERRTTAERPEKLSGVIERIQQDSHIRLLVMRLDAPAPGVAIVGVSDLGGSANASVNCFFYGDDAGSIAAASEQKWHPWLEETLSPVTPSKLA